MAQNNHYIIRRQVNGRTWHACHPTLSRFTALCGRASFDDPRHPRATLRAHEVKDDNFKDTLCKVCKDMIDD